jgi:hypothetical protein
LKIRTHHGLSCIELHANATIAQRDLQAVRT